MKFISGDDVMIKNLLLIFILTCQLAMSGCAFVAIGAATAGGGFGTYTYLEGELRKMYQGGHAESVRAATAALQELGMSVKDTNSYEIGTKTIIKAEKSDQTPVTVTIRSETTLVCEIAVRCGYVGIWDKQTAEQIHAAIGRQMSGWKQSG